MKFRSLLFVLLVLITLISASAQDSATEATSAGPDDNSADVDDKPDDVVYEEGKDTDKPDDFVDEGDKPDDVVYEEGKDTDKPDDFVDTGDNSAGTTDNTNTDDKNCQDEDIDAGKYEECKQLGMIVETKTDENGCKMTVCTKEDEPSGTSTEGDCNSVDIDKGKNQECLDKGMFAVTDTDANGCKMTVCKETLTEDTETTDSTDETDCETVDFNKGKWDECKSNGDDIQTIVDSNGCKMIACTPSTVEETGIDCETVDFNKGKWDECKLLGMDIETTVDNDGCKMIACKESDYVEESTDTSFECPSAEEIETVKENCKGQYVEGYDEKQCLFGMCKEPETGETEITETSTTCTVSKDADCVKVTCDEIGFMFNSCEDQQATDESGTTDNTQTEDGPKPMTKVGEWIKGFFKSDDKGVGNVMGLEEPVE